MGNIDEAAEVLCNESSEAKDMYKTIRDKGCRGLPNFKMYPHPENDGQPDEINFADFMDEDEVGVVCIKVQPEDNYYNNGS